LLLFLLHGGLRYGLLLHRCRLPILLLLRHRLRLNGLCLPNLRI